LKQQATPQIKVIPFLINVRMLLEQSQEIAEGSSGRQCEGEKFPEDLDAFSANIF
jgi:hypothetical protein